MANVSPQVQIVLFLLDEKKAQNRRRCAYQSDEGRRKRERKEGRKENAIAMIVKLIHEKQTCSVILAPIRWIASSTLTENASRVPTISS